MIYIFWSSQRFIFYVCFLIYIFQHFTNRFMWYLWISPQFLCLILYDVSVFIKCVGVSGDFRAIVYVDHDRSTETVKQWSIATVDTHHTPAIDDCLLNCRHTEYYTDTLVSSEPQRNTNPWSIGFQSNVWSTTTKDTDLQHHWIQCYLISRLLEIQETATNRSW